MFETNRNAALLLQGAAFLKLAIRFQLVSTLSAALAVLKTVLMRRPKNVKTAMTTKAIKEISKPYSTNVCPSSSCKLPAKSVSTKFLLSIFCKLAHHDLFAARGRSVLRPYINHTNDFGPGSAA